MGIRRKDEEETLAPHKCGVCDRCWLIIRGPRAGRCIYGGPYAGYERIPDASDEGISRAG